MKFSDYQKTELGTEVEVKSSSLDSPPPSSCFLISFPDSRSSCCLISFQIPKAHVASHFQVESTFPEEQFSPPPSSHAPPWFGPSGSLPHLNRPCLVHNGGIVPACPTHGPRGGPHAGVGPPPPPPNGNGCLPGQNSKYSGFSPERVI